MPARGLASTPREYVIQGAWPDGTLAKGAPFEARHVAEMAKRLKDAIGDRTLRSVAKESNVSIGTLSSLLGGKTWGDVVTLVRLEQALGVGLWSGGVHEKHNDGVATAKVSTGRSDTKSGRGDLTGSSKPLKKAQ
jgi:hypothetical protein